MPNSKKRAFITGVAGQDGSYLAEFLLQKGYVVFGLVRSSKKEFIKNLSEIHKNKRLILIKGSLDDEKSIENAIKRAKPDEVYNLAAQSDYMKSFENPDETNRINYRAVGFVVDFATKENPKVRIFQAGSSEMFGKALPPQNENTPFKPISPYGEAKLKAHEKYVVGYRKKYNLFVCSGILFNHESPHRGQNFVTRKITTSLAKIKLGLLDSFELGNIDAKRDWGFAPDYVEAMWKMLQVNKPQDFVIATGKAHTVRDFVEESAKSLDMKVAWKGRGLDEVLKDQNGKIILRINPKFYRPIDVHFSLGNNNKIKKILRWKPKHNFEDLVKIMTKVDFKELKGNHKK
ncbi:MAG: GDP-mannose 4,6-dehydratase [Minisyncoccia bacterium]